MRAARPDKHDLKHPLRLELPTFDEDADVPRIEPDYWESVRKSLECRSVCNYMLGATLRAGDGSETTRERDCRLPPFKLPSLTSRALLS